MTQNSRRQGKATRKERSRARKWIYRAGFYSDITVCVWLRGLSVS